MFEGRHDQQVPSSITASWMDQLKAPQKATIWFENSAHMMMIEEPGHTLDALLQIRIAARPGQWVQSFQNFEVALTRSGEAPLSSHLPGRDLKFP